MELVRVNATLDKNLLRFIDAYAEKMREDRSTAIRQLIGNAILALQKKEVLDAFKDKKLTLREAAKALGVDYWTIQAFLEDEGTAITGLTAAEVNERKQTVKKLASKRKK